MEHSKTVSGLQLPFIVTERWKTIVLAVCWLLSWTILMQDVLNDDGLVRLVILKWDPTDIVFTVLLLVICGPIPPLAVWFTSTTLLVNQDSIQHYKIFGLARRTYTIDQITDVQTFGMSALKTTMKKVRPHVALSFSDGSNVTFTAAAINFDRLLKYLELKATKIQMAE